MRRKGRARCIPKQISVLHAHARSRTVLREEAGGASRTSAAGDASPKYCRRARLHALHSRNRFASAPRRRPEGSCCERVEIDLGHVQQRGHGRGYDGHRQAEHPDADVAVGQAQLVLV